MWGEHGRPHLYSWRQRHQPGAGAARRLRREAPPALARPSSRSGRTCRVPTAHRLVAELVEWGALARADDGRYVVGRRLWDLGLLAPVQTGLRQLASPYLHDLYGATLATVHLAVRDNLEVLYVDRLSGHASVPVVSQIGSRLPIHATGVGKVLLAHAPADVQARVLGATAGPPHAVHRHPAGIVAPPARPSAAGRLRHHGRGDVARRLLGRGADPARRVGRRRPGHRAPAAGQGPAAPGGRAAGRGARDRADLSSELPASGSPR